MLILNGVVDFYIQYLILMWFDWEGLLIHDDFGIYYVQDLNENFIFLIELKIDRTK